MPPKRRHRKVAGSTSSPQTPSLLNRVLEFYQQTFGACAEAAGFLREHGLSVPGLLEPFSPGYCDGSLLDTLPEDGPIRKTLKKLGILSANGRETFHGCLTLPMFDIHAGVVSLAGLNIQTAATTLLKLSPTHVWNIPACTRHTEVFFCEGIIDALSLAAAGFPNIAACVANTLTPGDIDVINAHGLRKITVFGPEAHKALAEPGPGIDVFHAAVPECGSLNAYLLQSGPEKLAEYAENPTRAAPRAAAPKAPAAPARAAAPKLPPNIQPQGEGFVATLGRRKYAVLSLEKTGRKLRTTIRVEHAGRLHVDTLDMYLAKARKNLCFELCKLFEQPAEAIESDITKLIGLCETYQPSEDAGQAQQALSPAMSEDERVEAVEFGRDPELMDLILADYEACGLVGEEPNKLLCYLAGISRKMEEPLSVLILSSSGAGKTALQDTTLLLCPPEDVVKLTTLTGRALFYKGRKSLKHKILALEEDAGAEDATYAIRNLISAGELVIESTVKDLGTGKLTTMEHRVEGPTAVFVTTTNPETDPETRSRFFVTSIDESRKQTRAILEFQRLQQTIEGRRRKGDLGFILRRHHNFQRLLEPMAVVNPFAPDLAYTDDRLQSRRDQPKYLNLIRAVAFMRQMQKEILQFDGDTPDESTVHRYIAVDEQDVRLAHGLACDILGRSLDDLNRVSRDLLEQIERLVKKKARDGSGPAGKPLARQDVLFTRRDIREFTGWAHCRVERYLKELVDFEYVIVAGGRNGSAYRYRLAYEGQGKDGSRFVLGFQAPPRPSRREGGR